MQRYIEESGLTEAEFLYHAKNTWLPLCKVNKGVAKLFRNTCCSKLLVLNDKGEWVEPKWGDSYRENGIYRLKDGLRGKAYLESLPIGTVLVYQDFVVRVCRCGIIGIDSDGDRCCRVNVRRIALLTGVVSWGFVGDFNPGRN